jgi:hypothetical protein
MTFVYNFIPRVLFLNLSETMSIYICDSKDEQFGSVRLFLFLLPSVKVGNRGGVDRDNEKWLFAIMWGHETTKERERRAIDDSQVYVQLAVPVWPEEI